MDASNLQIISAATALIAVTVAPLITLYVAKMQSNVSVLAKSRQEWINTLREEISQIIVIIRSMEVIMGIPSEKQDPKILLRTAEQGKLKESKIRLLINPDETDHVELVEAIHKALSRALNGMTNNAENKISLDVIESEIIEKTQKILKREWSRVKALK